MNKIILSLLFAMLIPSPVALGRTVPLSEKTEVCMECHETLTPGIVKSWERSRHANVTPAQGLKKESNQRRVSNLSVSEPLLPYAVGCAECHTAHPTEHADTFEHNDYSVHTVVTPRDCRQCHPVETHQYQKNIMSHAYGNLRNNPLFNDLADSINGIPSFDGGTAILKGPDEATDADSCYYCHGTEVKLQGTQERETELGEMTFPILSGWPNRGVGRINPDGTKGSCTACHPRHGFSIETARKPHTCAECHKGPDVPAYKVYSVSKHGGIQASEGNDWHWQSVPWTVGRDFTAPTCATCHVSLVTSEDGEVIAERTHQMNDRLAWRIFGLIYAHPHPRSPDTTGIKNQMDLPLPTELTGEPVTAFTIGPEEMEKRRQRLKNVCRSCHSTGWVNGHFSRFENTIRVTNAVTLNTTRLILSAWENGIAKGPAHNDSPFNETIEKKWVEQWLFYANSIRFSSAMAGADYGVFANGRWYLSKNFREILDLITLKMKNLK